MIRTIFSVLIFGLLFTFIAYSQAVDTLDDELARTIAREMPQWKNKTGGPPFRLIGATPQSATMMGEWEKGGKRLTIIVTLNKAPEGVEQDFQMFFRRQIMPRNRPITGVGARAVLAETARTVEIAFSKENMFVSLDYNYSSTLSDSRTPYYYESAPKSEADTLIKIAMIVDTSINHKREFAPCHNDFYNSGKTKPQSGPEEMLDAALNGNAARVKMLLSNGVGTHGTDGDGNTPLHSAIRTGCEDTVKALVSAGASLNAKTSKGETPLMTASSLGDPKIMEILLNAGAEVNERDVYGRNAAFFAIPRTSGSASLFKSSSYEDYMAALKLLRQAGVNINERMSLNGDSLLTYQMYSYGPRLNLIQDLIDLGVGVNGRVAGGKTILIRAVTGTTPDSRNKLVALLIKNGADVNIKDDEGFTAMDYVLEDQKRRAGSPEWRKDFAETIRLLQEAGLKH